MLNQLADEGVDVDEAKQDLCLLANLSRVSRAFFQKKKTFFVNKTKRFLKLKLQKFASTYLIDCNI